MCEQVLLSSYNMHKSQIYQKKKKKRQRVFSALPLNLQLALLLQLQRNTTKIKQCGLEISGLMPQVSFLSSEFLEGNVDEGNYTESHNRKITVMTRNMSHAW